MSLMYICDRCGAKIQDYSTDKHYVKCLIDADCPDGRKYFSYDLCPQCQKILMFLNESFITFDKNNNDILYFLGVDEDGNSVR